MTITANEKTDLGSLLAPYTARRVPRSGSRRRIGALAWLTLGEKARRQ